MVMHRRHGLADTVQSHVHLPLHSVAVREQTHQLHHNLQRRNKAQRCSHQKKNVSYTGTKSKSVNWICSGGSLHKNGPVLCNIHSKNGFLRIIPISSSRWNKKRKVQVWVFAQCCVMINLVGGSYIAHLLIIFPQTLKIAPTVIRFSHTQSSSSMQPYRCPTDGLCTQGCRKPSPLCSPIL